MDLHYLLLYLLKLVYCIIDSIHCYPPSGLLHKGEVFCDHIVGMGIARVIFLFSQATQRVLGVTSLIYMYQIYQAAQKPDFLI